MPGPLPCIDSFSGNFKESTVKRDRFSETLDCLAKPAQPTMKEKTFLLGSLWFHITHSFPHTTQCGQPFLNPMDIRRTKWDHRYIRRVGWAMLWLKNSSKSQRLKIATFTSCSGHISIRSHQDISVYRYHSGTETEQPPCWVSLKGSRVKLCKHVENFCSVNKVYISSTHIPLTKASLDQAQRQWGRKARQGQRRQTITVNK